MADPGHQAATVAEHAEMSLAVVLVRRGAAAAAAERLRDRCGLELPPPGRLTANGATWLLWSGPDRLLAVRAGIGLADELGATLHDVAYVADASASRAVFTVSGDAAAEALSRRLPIDLHPRVFAAGSVAVTVAQHIPVQVWRPDGDAAFWLACPASYAASLRQALAGDHR